MKSLKSRLFRTCPKSGRIVGVRQPEGWTRVFFPLVGLAALVWFAVRVVPKPSRAAYPCQRVAMPLASSFVLWLAGMAGAGLAIGGARRNFRQARWLSGGLAVMLAVVGLGWGVASLQSVGYAGEPVERVEYTPPPANAPIGTAKGLAPGRVVWVHDPAVTNWQGPSASTLWYNAIDQSVANAMVSQSLRTYADTATDGAAWDATFRSFNGGAPYQAGEKVFIKVNLTTSNYGGNGAVTFGPGNEPQDYLQNELDDPAGTALVSPEALPGRYAPTPGMLSRGPQARAWLVIPWAAPRRGGPRRVRVHARVRMLGYG